MVLERQKTFLLGNWFQPLFQGYKWSGKTITLWKYNACNMFEANITNIHLFNIIFVCWKRRHYNRLVESKCSTSLCGIQNRNSLLVNRNVAKYVNMSERELQFYELGFCDVHAFQMKWKLLIFAILQSFAEEMLTSSDNVSVNFIASCS